MLKKNVLWISAVIVGIIGFWGFSLANPGDTLWNLYCTVRLYGLNTDLDADKMNAFIEIARWLAPFITGGAILFGFHYLKFIGFKIRGFFVETAVVYGTSAEAEKLQAGIENSFLEQGKKLRTNRKGAKQIVFFDNDKENLEFFAQIKNKLKNNDKVYISLSGISRDSIDDSSTVVFNMCEICAREYWSEFMMTKSEKVAIIGFSDLGQAILNFGINKNVFSLEQKVEYFVYGDFKECTSTHLNGFSDFLKPDTIEFKYNWLDDFAKIQFFDRIILTGGEQENLLILDKILMLSPFKEIHVKASSKELFRTMYNNSKIIPFGTADDLCVGEMILQEKLMADAKNSHASYVKENPGAPPWESLNCFTRYSNVALFDHKDVKVHLFRNGMDIEEIGNLEHIRWCRYHYLNNWTHGEQRNNELRIHPLLVPFSELCDSEKEKDYAKVREIISGLSNDYID